MLELEVTVGCVAGGWLWMEQIETFMHKKTYGTNHAKVTFGNDDPMTYSKVSSV